MGRHAMLIAFLLLSGSAFAQYDCTRWKDEWNNLCKSCTSASSYEYLRYKQAGSCLSCGGWCRSIPQSAPADKVSEVEGSSFIAINAVELEAMAASAGVTEQCSPDFSAARNDKYYALNLDRETYAGIAAASPIVAELLLALRTRERMPPLKLHGGDGTNDRMPTAESVLRAYDFGAEDVSVEPLTKTLSAREFIALDYDVERFEDGSAVLTVRTELRQLGSKSGKPIDERFRVLLRATGDTRPIGQIDGVVADVYDVIGFEVSAKGI